MGGGELVATIRIDEFRTTVDLLDELACAVFQAVVGTSRLPLTSVETPLPAFSRLLYFPAGPGQSDPVLGVRQIGCPRSDP